MAVHDADAVLFLTDGTSGVTSPDREVAEILRRYQKTCGRSILASNFRGGQQMRECKTAQCCL